MVDRAVDNLTHFPSLTAPGIARDYDDEKCLILRLSRKPSDVELKGIIEAVRSHLGA